MNNKVNLKEIIDILDFIYKKCEFENTYITKEENPEIFYKNFGKMELLNFLKYNLYSKFGVDKK